MDATQTSDPTGAGPGSPGQASAFRRALDDQALHGEAAKEGPLDLTVPLDFAEIRAALSSSGSNPKPPAPEAAAAPPAGGARHGRGGRGGGHAAPPGHTGSRRLGRIGVFVGLTTALSVGTAAALVLSSGGQGASVSLPTTNGNIPVATAAAGGPGGRIPLSATTLAAGFTPSALPSTAVPSPATAASSAPAASSSADAPSPSASAPSQTSISPSASAAPASQDPVSPTSGSSTFTTIQEGSTGTEVTEVQQMLAAVDLLYQQRQRHHTVFVDVYDETLSDPSGTYGTATEEAVAAFQQQNDVGSELGICDQATFDALSAMAGGQPGG